MRSGGCRLAWSKVGGSATLFPWSRGSESGIGDPTGSLSAPSRAASSENCRGPNESNRSASCPASCLRWQRQAGGGALADLDITGLVRELTEAGVDFFVIGGVAVGYHGYVRATKDLDVVPSPEATNLERLAAVLSRLEAVVDGADEFSPDELPDPLDPAALETGGNWVLKTRLGRLDIMQWVGEIDLWNEMSKRAISDEIAGVTVKIVDFHDLVRLKELAGRPEDLTDLDRLREVRDE